DVQGGARGGSGSGARVLQTVVVSVRFSDPSEAAADLAGNHSVQPAGRGVAGSGGELDVVRYIIRRGQALRIAHGVGNHFAARIGYRGDGAIQVVRIRDALGYSKDRAFFGEDSPPGIMGPGGSATGIAHGGHSPLGIGVR